MERVRQRKREMVDGLVAMHLDNYQASGAELIMGDGALRRAENAGGQPERRRHAQLTGERVFLNVGTHATIPPIPGLAEAGR